MADPQIDERGLAVVARPKCDVQKQIIEMTYIAALLC
jgi:hypothetical protein